MSLYVFRWEVYGQGKSLFMSSVPGVLSVSDVPGEGSVRVCVLVHRSGRGHQQWRS